LRSSVPPMDSLVGTRSNGSTFTLSY
jgi:hypothetical protein